MDRGNRENRRGQKLEYFKEEQGYLLMSTLFFLVFSGLFSHSIIKISANQIMQIRQFATAYEAKGALNMSEDLLNAYIEQNEEYPTKGKIRTSIGNIEIKKKSEEFYDLTLTLENGTTFSKEAKVLMNIPEESEEVEEELIEMEDDVSEEEEDKNVESEETIEELETEELNN